VIEKNPRLSHDGQLAYTPKFRARSLFPFVSGTHRKQHIRSEKINLPIGRSGQGAAQTARNFFNSSLPPCPTAAWQWCSPPNRHATEDLVSDA